MAVTIDAYDHFIELIGKAGVVQLENDDLKGILLNASHNFNPALENYSQISANEIAGSFGYLQGGVSLTGKLYVQTGGVVKFSSNQYSWSAVGGSIVARNSVIYDDDTVSPADALLIDINFGTSDESAGAGTDFIVNPDPTNGWYTGEFTAASA